MYKGVYKRHLNSDMKCMIYEMFKNLILFLPLLVCGGISAQTMPDLPPIDVDQSYGTECGFTRIVPAYRDSIEGFVERKKIDDVDRWLRSGKDIKTVYAIEALHRLKAQHKIGVEQMQIIRHYMENDIPITCCGRGIPESCSSKEVLATFEF